MDTTFNELGLIEPIKKALDELGFEKPTPVQEASIPKVLDQKDIIVLAKTGSGKTGAFGIPVLQNIDTELKEPQAIMLTPTRELAVQVNKDLMAFNKYHSVKTTVVYGGHNMQKEIDDIHKGAQIIVGTPGRMLDHLKKGNIKTKNVKYFVLDEADRMLDMGFIDQVKSIIKALPRRRTTMLFSATMPLPIQNICKAYMFHPQTIEFEVETMTVDAITQHYYRVDRREKSKRLLDILRMKEPDRCMVFCNTKQGVDMVQRFLYQRGYMTEALHGDKTQNRRLRTIDQFKKGDIQVLVATDVAARGIHIDDMELVINFDVPEDKDSYVHRIGRTGRAGQDGLAISLVTSESIMTLYEIEEHINAMIEEMDLPTEEEVHEAMKLANGRWVQKRKDAKIKRKNHDNERKSSSNRQGQKSRQDRPKRSNQRKDQQQGKSDKPKTHKDRPAKQRPQSSKPQAERKQHTKPQGAKTHTKKPKQDTTKRVEVKRDQVKKPVVKKTPPAKKPQVTEKPGIRPAKMKGYVREVTKDNQVIVRKMTFMERVKGIFK